MAAILVACSTSTLHVSEAKPIPICIVTCPNGWVFENHTQHLCKGSTKWYTDELAHGRQTERNVDGTVKLDMWLGREGDYPVADTEIGTCASLISRVISLRATEERGQHPGEDPSGHSLSGH